jgi:hypothetical protein
MINLSSLAKAYIFSIIVVGLGLIGWAVTKSDWANAGLYLLAALGGVGRALKVEGTNTRTNYSIAWFVYGFALIAYGRQPRCS